MKRSLRGQGGTSTPSEADLNQEQKKQFDMMKGLAQQYQGKGQDQILHDLNEAIRKGKADGSLTDEKISQLVRTISPMLNGDQKSKLDQLMRMMKTGQ